MMKAGATKVGLPKPGHERTRTTTVTSPTSSAMKTTRSNLLAPDHRLSRLKRANSDDALTKPALTSASGSRLKKTVTTGAISDLPEARPRSSAGSQTKRSGIPGPKEISSSVSRDRVSKDQPRSSTNKRMVSSASTSSLSTLAKQTRNSTKSRGDPEGPDKGLLENQVKELLAEAKAKDLEISNLRAELQRCKIKVASSSCPSSPTSHNTERQEAPADREQEQVTEALVLVAELREKNSRFQRELAALREENQLLKEKLICLESSVSPTANSSSPTKILVNGLPSDSSVSTLSSPSPVKTSPSSDTAKDSPSPDSSEFEKIPSRSESMSSGVSTDAVSSGPSTVQQDRSLQSLTEQIHKMEESHHSTAEELQATLQELSDQQQMVQELTAENERLSEEKRLLQTSLQQQRERVEVLVQKNEALVQAQREDGSQGTRLSELEQRYKELVESSRFEREKLVDIQQQLTGSLRALEQEHQEAQAQAFCLREELERVQAHTHRELQAAEQAVQVAEEHRVTAEALRLDNSRLKAQVDIERQKVTELKALQGTSDSSELQNLLKTAHCEREQLEHEMSERRQQLLQAQAEAEHAQAALAKVESKCQQIQERAEQREQELLSQVAVLEEAGLQAENQVKELKETIFELEDQVEQQRAVGLHTNQTVLDMENLVKKLEEQKADSERQMKALSRQIKDEKEEWRRFQADLQTAVVVANDIKVEAQQELRALRRQLQEEQERNTKLTEDLEALRGVRSQGDEAGAAESDNKRHWCGISVMQATPTTGDPSREPPADTEPGATVKSLIKSFDTVGQNGPSHTLQMPSSQRSPLSAIPVRSAPAAAISPMQRHSYIKPLSKTLEKRINLGEFSHHHGDKLSGCEDLKPGSLMRKSPSLESVIKTPATLSSRASSFSYHRGNSKLSVERKDPLAALAREYGGSKRNALLKWCQKKTQGYPNIDVTNFSSSWSDGLAFCALLHTYLPAHIPYQELISQDKVRNLTLAFQAAESIGIKPSLDIEELMRTDRPDWQSVMQYVSQIYKYFET
ncbi:cytospin-B [Boleophthalmus pectinirostris]|uniref:cytospin-B n=1 Tax=Boleophthalmus pectinirostris TaxID=150288 RepID=UPI00242FDA1D|nr:cytospin-B [Boleophthalmus pectinirostris]